MGKKLKNLSFDDWVRYVFDHPVTKPQWYFDLDADWWDERKDPSLSLSYLTQLFENPVKYVDRYTDAQLNQGFWFLVDNSCSNHMFVLLDEKLSWEKRERCFSAIFSLFEQVFADRCSPHLSHLDEQGANPLNLVCYMWWDIIPIYGQPDKKSHAAMDALILDVMHKTLWLKQDACRESALHGLGHWAMYYPEQVEKIIDDFLERKPGLRPELKAYAQRARRGMVL